MNPLSKILLGVGLAVAFVIIVAFLYLVIANAHLKTQLAQSQANATACHLANDAFAAQIIRQNQSVDKLKTDSLLREKQAQDAALQARTQAQLYRQDAARLSARKAGADRCASADTLINDYLRGAK